MLIEMDDGMGSQKSDNLIFIEMGLLIENWLEYGMVYYVLKTSSLVILRLHVVTSSTMQYRR